MDSRIATCAREAQHPTLWDRLECGWCPSITGPTGGKVYDLSGNNLHGTLTSMDVATDWVIREGRSGIDQDGSNDRVISDAGVPSLANDFNATIAIWVHMASVATTWRCIASFVGNAEGFGMFGPGPDGTGSIAAGIYGGRRVYSSTGLLTTARWHHIAITKSSGSISTANTRIYLDGMPLSTSVSGTGAPSSTTAPKIYAGGDPFNEYSNPMVWDDLLVYSRVLTEQEVLTLATSRGVIYTPRQRNVFYRQVTSSNRRRRLLTSGVTA